MSLTFACGHCGKSFSIDPKFAGKKGRCKQCGALMLIPDAGGLVPLPEEPKPHAVVSYAAVEEVIPPRKNSASSSPDRRPSRVEQPSSRPVAMASTRASSLDEPPPVDHYGFDDEPMPSRAPRGWESNPVATPNDSGPGIPRKKKKKSMGFFASSGKSSASGDRSAATYIVLRIFFGIIGLAGSSLIIPGIRSAVTPGWAFHSDIETFVKRQVDLTNELTGILRNVHDIQTASAASGAANEKIRQMEQNLRDNKDRKGAIKDIEAIKAKYAGQQQSSVNSFTSELERIKRIPGAIDALSILAALIQLGEVEQTIPGFQQNNNAAAFRPPPVFNPPPVNPNPNPNFNPNPNPNFNPGFPNNRQGAGAPSRPSFPGRRGRN